MNQITEIKRLKTPFALPQALAWDGKNFWMSSLDTNKIYQIDPITWNVLWKIDALGSTYGLVSTGENLHALYSMNDEDDRAIGRLIPGKSFDSNSKIICPEETGSQLSFDGEYIYVSQWYNKSILQLHSDGNILRTVSSPRGVCGQTIVGNDLYFINTEEEEEGEYWLTKIDLNSENLEPEDIALVPFQARSLAFDGANFWSNHRAASETVCFKI